ncbi:Heme A synthase [Aurantimicrobium photophilum]|uniref:Heme A synthase n=1 Tax=Aurantimicrobium photophilum TaxID=1987356 RepID=A0A2Z3S2V1_9MICO|nr:Heme A synthase [Aurantimicrobium photophilum]
MNWFPTTVDRKVRIAAWTTFVVQILIVVTGGAVRLTASGLGCPTWPTCTEDSLVNTPEMGIHGIIEFGNRLLTFLLVIVAIVTFALVFRMRKSRRDFFWLTLLIGLGIPAQAVIGGISVLMQLNPYVVGLHFIVSIVMIVLSTVLVFRVYNGNAPRTWILSPSGLSLPRIVWLAAVFQIVTIILGILTTGSGPHAGDADAPRNGLDGGILQSLHSYPAYVAVGLTLLAIAMASRARQLAERNALLMLLAVNVAQIVVGIVQSRTGLPPLLVGIHMLLACLVAAGTTNALLNLRKPAE